LFSLLFSLFEKPTPFYCGKSWATENGPHSALWPI